MLLSALITLIIGPSLEAQDTFTPIQLGPVTLTGSVRDRVENWEWFTPTTGNPKYTFDDNTIRLGISENLQTFRLDGRDRDSGPAGPSY
jgi:hypothetical protein